MSAEEGQELSRRDRKKLETQQRFEEQLAEMQAAARDVHKGESPFSVTMEQDAVAEGSRNISFNKVSVSVNGKALFKDTQVKLSAGCRYGLMGPNGRGKSTLLRLLVTRELPVQKSLHMMLVEQEQEMEAGDLSAVDAVLQSHKVQKAYEEEAAVLRDVAELTSEQLERLNFLENELNIMGAQQSDAKARRILYGLGFPTDWHDRPTSSFSGGWRKRIALACAVFIEPDVLMLDEPTNHLDLNAVIWLESYLGQQYSETARRPKTLIVVSHDAGFLDEVCTHIVHIENFKIRYYRGGYSQFETQLEQAHAEADKKNEQIMKKISEQKRQGKSKVQVAEWLKEQCRLGKVDEEFVARRTEYSVTFPFSQPPELRDACIIKLEDVAFNYPNGPELFRGVSCALWSDSRITLCGPNGIGKSTLLGLMTGDLEPTEGHVQLNRQVRIGRYTQHFIDKLPLERTPVEFLVSLGMKAEDGRAQLGCFGLEGVCHNQICASLSGGQKARVALAALTLPKPHFLLFDEPTNHLDLESIEALCDAINGFAGGILVVTHDARLIERTSMQLWIAGNKTAVPFRGDLNDYKAMIRRDFLREEAAREAERLEKQRSKMEAKQHGGVEAAVAAKAAAAAVEKEKLADEADALFAELDKKKKKKKKE